MERCCTSSHENKPKARLIKQPCPSCHQPALDVSMRTVMQHVKEVWNHDFSEQTFYFCRSQDCDVVYFTAGGECINKPGVRTTIGIKEKSENSMICYCFGVSKAEAKKKEIKKFVVNQTSSSTCACETANPSGRCCLKDFPK